MERWLPICGYEGLYEVSSLGRVRSLPRIARNRSSAYLTKERILKGRPDRVGYMCVQLCKDGIAESRKVHRLVAAAFLGEPPIEKRHVNHIDFKKDHNAVENLEWCSPQANHRHAVDGGRLDGAVSHKRAKKLNAEIVLQIRAAKANGEGSRKLARRFAISSRTIRRVLSRQIWSRV